MNNRRAKNQKTKREPCVKKSISLPGTMMEKAIARADSKYRGNVSAYLHDLVDADLKASAI